MKQSWVSEVDMIIPKEKEKRKIFFKMMIPYLIAFAVALFIGFYFTKISPVAFVSGNSMYPTLKDGNVISCTTDTTSIQRGDIVVIKTGFHKLIIKRVIALPGETIEIKNGITYVNGICYEEFEFEKIEDAGILADKPLTLSGDEFFVMGDNRNHSSDSRKMGAIKQENIIYKKQEVEGNGKEK